MKKSVVIVSMIFMLLLVGLASADDTLYVTKQNYPMASTEEDLDMFQRSLVNNDTAVFLKLRQEGRAWMSKAGVEVYVVEDKGSGRIQIQPKNSTQIIWTLAGAVRKK
jgi:outer membrane lipoprotein SlyB